MVDEASAREVELKARIEAELRHHGDSLPAIVNAAWRGYLAACLEWSLIEVAAYGRLFEILPPLGDDPSVGIFLGREDS